MSKIFVTGATGYIGSHVCKALKQAGYEVVGLDRVHREHTIKHMDRFIEADYHSAVCFDALAYEQPDAIIHLAGTSLVGPSMADPGEYYTNNVAKTAALLDVARWLEKMPVVVFSSSAAVYGSPDVDVIYENQPYSPMSPYGSSKAMIEIMLVDFNKAYGMKSACLRYFNACGADLDGELGQEPGATHIIARVLESLRDQSDQFVLNGKDFATEDGTCVRDYIHVEDLAQAHILAIDRTVPGGVYNLGTNQGYSNLQILHGAIGITKQDLAYTVGPRRAGDPATLTADASKFMGASGWQPRHGLEDMITHAWAWYNR